jgi:hypothetical protein
LCKILISKVSAVFGGDTDNRLQQLKPKRISVACRLSLLLNSLNLVKCKFVDENSLTHELRLLGDLFTD